MTSVRRKTQGGIAMIGLLIILTIINLFHRTEHKILKPNKRISLVTFSLPDGVKVVKKTELANKRK